MATSTAQKWLIGCGIGCGVIVLVLIMVATGTCLFVRSFVEEISQVKDSERELTSSFGELEEYTPAPDGSIEPSRIETFLEVRVALAEEREEMHRFFDRFPPDEGKGIWTFFKVVGGMAGMIGDIITYIDARNRALLEHGMGYGEYLYIYCMAYYSWLEHDPADGPEHEGERLFDEDDSTFGARQIYRQYRELMLAQLRNQLDALPEEADEARRTRLLEEIDELDRERRHIAWRGDLPPALAASLEPYREPLETVYDPETNSFELPPEEDESGGIRWDVD